MCIYLFLFVGIIIVYLLDVEGSGIGKAHSVLTHSSSADAASKITSKQAVSLTVAQYYIILFY